MQKKLSDLIKNKLELDENSVWVLDKTKKFNYSDGVASENYLRKVISEAEDITSNSYELEKSIIDWNSEYHLSRKRSQLLRGFNYDSSKKILEVGCGCGAITRFLGENFDDVVAIEGSSARAGIARLRTRDQDNVSIVCAPFQKIEFREKFDIIFCIGVFEYSNMFVSSHDPYKSILEYFHEILSPGGEVIIAIENQFGLKYFSSAAEDHSGVMFDGLEGYTRFNNRNAKTFGYTELTNLLRNKFNAVDFYFPYPDYKMPSCLLSEEFLQKKNCGELVGVFRDKSLLDQPKSMFDERLVLLELQKNNMLSFFSNSFLVIAGKQNIVTNLKQLGFIYSDSRTEKFQTVTKFTENEDGKIVARKTPLSGENIVSTEQITLHSCESPWIDGLSIHTQLLTRVKDQGLNIKELFEPCEIWKKRVQSMAVSENGILRIEGKYIDCIWQNSFVYGDECFFIDQEWEWHNRFDIKRLVIKSIYEFLNDIQDLNDVNPQLKSNSKQNLIIRIADVLGVRVSNKDVYEFCVMEAEMAEIINGKDKKKILLHLKLDLYNSNIVPFLLSGKRLLGKITRILKI
jgi:2-polyprenyl-3-methyl-5-hydroxy-6-metoxy-1,4-benzoquinol methylase